MLSQNDYTFSLADSEVNPGRQVPVAFTINGPDGAPVTAYDEAHGKQLHLIAVRHDFRGFQHVHPVLGVAGVWSIDLDLDPDRWRLFADFAATGAEPVTLAADLSVTGTVSPHAPPPESRTSEIDGYTVGLAGDLVPGTHASLTLNVSRGGREDVDLQPYLGAYGHLVALRADDLAYLHVHPDGAPGDGITPAGPNIVFHAAAPSAGTYHLYLDFRHGGVVRTAWFTVTAADDPTASADALTPVVGEAGSAGASR